MNRVFSAFIKMNHLCIKMNHVCPPAFERPAATRLLPAGAAVELALREIAPWSGSGPSARGAWTRQPVALDVVVVVVVVVDAADVVVDVAAYADGLVAFPAAFPRVSTCFACWFAHVFTKCVRSLARGCRAWGKPHKAHAIVPFGQIDGMLLLGMRICAVSCILDWPVRKTSTPHAHASTRNKKKTENEAKRNQFDMFVYKHIFKSGEICFRRYGKLEQASYR